LARCLDKGETLRREGCGSLPDLCMWDIWWAKWHEGRVFSEHLGVSLSLSFHQCFRLSHSSLTEDMILAVDSVVK